MLDVPASGNDTGGRKILLVLSDEQFPECYEKSTEKPTECCLSVSHPVGENRSCGQS